MNTLVHVSSVNPISCNWQNCTKEMIGWLPNNMKLAKQQSVLYLSKVLMPWSNWLMALNILLIRHPPLRLNLYLLQKLIASSHLCHCCKLYSLQNLLLQKLKLIVSSHLCHWRTKFPSFILSHSVRFTHRMSCCAWWLFCWFCSMYLPCSNALIISGCKVWSRITFFHWLSISGASSKLLQQQHMIWFICISLHIQFIGYVSQNS